MNILGARETMMYLVIILFLIPSIAAYAQVSQEEYVMGKLNWAQACFRIFNITATATVHVTDPDMNKFSSSTDIIKVFVYSDSYPEGITLTLYETEFDSGIFERTFGLSDKRSAPSVLYVQEGDTITAKYVDATLPPPHTSSIPLELSETAFIGCSSPPLERVPASAARITDSTGNAIESVTAGKQVNIISDIANGQSREQKFAWITQIANERNKIVSLGWIDGMLNPESSFSPSISWIPEREGRYTATMFVWESLDNPTALSPPISIDLEVKEEPKIPKIVDGDDSEFKYPRPGEGIVERYSHSPLKQFKSGIPIDKIECKEELILVLKSSDDSPVCVRPETKQKLIERGWQNTSDVNVMAKQNANISAINYKFGQIVNEPITDFYVKIEGTGYNYHPPKLWINNKDNSTVWTNDHITYLGDGRSMPGDFCKEYTFYSIGGPVIINATGLYTLYMSFEGHTASYQLSVKENQTEYNYPTYGKHCVTTLSDEVNGYDNFIFTVSNQSMDKESVDILVQIDDEVVIDSVFEAGNQHNFHDYGFLLTEGNHTIAAKSRGENVLLIQDFTIDDKQWGYLSYWYEEENEKPRFNLILDDKEFNFE